MGKPSWENHRGDIKGRVNGNYSTLQSPTIDMSEALKPMDYFH